MQLACPSCARTLEYSGERPRFCSFCGNSLSTVAVTLDEYAAADERTAPPSNDWAAQEAATIAAVTQTPEADRRVPEVVGGYRLLRRLGGGGMGAVYEGEEIATGRHVALKLILPEIAGTGEALERFRQEGRLASAVAHPRYVFVLAAEEDAGRLALI